MPPGPVPKKEAERRRRNKDAVATEVINLDEILAGERVVPTADENWHPVALNLFESLKTSGQSIFMEPSDWATAYMLVEILDRWLKPQDVKVGQEGSERDATGGGNVNYIFEEKIVAMPGGVLTAILKGLSALMVTEGDRRRLRLELERKSAIDAALGASNIIDINASREEAFRQAAKQG